MTTNTDPLLFRCIIFTFFCVKKKHRCHQTEFNNFWITFWFPCPRKWPTANSTHNLPHHHHYTVYYLKLKTADWFIIHLLIANSWLNISFFLTKSLCIQHFTEFDCTLQARFSYNASCRYVDMCIITIMFIMYFQVLILLGRAVNIFPLSFLLNYFREHKITRKMQFVMWFSGKNTSLLLFVTFIPVKSTSFCLVYSQLTSA